MATPFDGIGGLLGIDPAQLQQLMAQFAPTEDDRKAANMQALAQLGFGLLGTRKGYEWDQVGNAAQNALQARQSALQGAQQGKADLFKTAQGLAKYKQEQDAAKQAQVMNNEIGALLQGGGQPQGEGVPEQAKWQIYLMAAEKAALGGNMAQAKHWADLAEKHKPKFSTTPHIGNKEGKVGNFVLDEMGNEKQLSFAPPPKFMTIDDGKTKQIRNEYLMPETGVNVAMQTTPGQDMQHREWQADYGLRRNADQRAAASQGSGPKAPEGYRWTADGKSMEFIPGGPQDPSKVKPEKPSDEQLKTGGFVDRMQFADKYISAIEKSGYAPSAGQATVQGLSGVPLIGGVLGSAASTAQGWVEPKAAEYKNAKKAWIRAKLRKESGAVIGAEEEADEDRTFFPQPGDPPSVRAQKAALRKNTEQAMAKQARGGYQGGAVQDDPLGLRQ